MKIITHLQSQELYIIIPVFDHDEHLKEIIQTLTGKGYKNIIVVNDGSEKDIFKQISEFNIHYLHHRQNLGQGAALQTGFDYAAGLDAEFVVTFDADGQHDPNDLPVVLAPVVAGRADVSLGSRFLSSQPTNIPFSKKLLLQTARFFNFLFTGLMLTDAHNGLRALNRKALNKIRITENRMAHATEILVEAKKHHLLIEEVPVTIHYTDYSIKHGQSSWNSLRIFIDLVFYKLFS
ncbi:MAG TPA: glycosyltransferase family 2 protein [Chitinophagaceae bacterium]|nr:glycosyltransferase family 2 protein [Chitinophagaceae bacterium]